METSMNETKPALASSAVWGALLAGISAGAMLAGIKIEGLDDPELPLQISGLVGAVLALYGRLRASAEINGWLK
jgi:peptidase E